MKIAVLLSGGVDSAVALRLLKDQGHDITAFYLKIWMEDELSHLGNCPWQEDLDFAQKICSQADVPLEVVPMQREYFDNIVKYTIKEVKQGRTPNPDVLCNNHIKFGLFFDKISDKFDKVATGHYAQITEHNGTPHLKRAPDPIKDQTYFLSHLKSEQLKRIVFPIGHLSKLQVRKLAKKYDLPNKDRKDSQGICFLGKIKFREFIEHYLGEKPGDILESESKKKLGTHRGFWFYTTGQRKDIRLNDGPWFVVKKDPATNTIYVSNHYEEKKEDNFNIDSENWFAGHAPDSNTLQVKIRHGEHDYNCTLDQNHVKLDAKDQGIAPGQFAAFYDGEVCLGSGVIC